MDDDSTVVNVVAGESAEVGPEVFDSEPSDTEPTQESIPRDVDSNTFSPNEEAILVGFFANRPMFWDKNDPNHSDQRGVRARELAEQASAMGTTVAQISKWFRSQRTAYTRNKASMRKRASGASVPKHPPTARMQWNMESFNFLDQHIKVQTTTSQMGRVSTN